MGGQAEAAHSEGAAIAYMEASARMGYARAEGAMGMAYLQGNGVRRDPQKGMPLLEQAAAQGNRGAAVELGMVYEDGVDGVPRDQARAISYLKGAAELHHSVAEHRIGLDYELGNGLPHDRNLAVMWLRRAAADGG
jgi:TPR repeat protein